METFNLIQHELSPGEHLLWSGQPRGGIRFRASDVFVVPFSLLWGFFVIAWTATAALNAPVFALWGVPFVLVGLYFMVGRFVVDAWQRARTYYGLSNERIIIISGLFNRTVKSINLDTLSDLTLTEKNDRSGTITFGPTMPWASWYRTTAWTSTSLMPAFDMVENAKDVFERIRAAQREARRRE